LESGTCRVAGGIKDVDLGDVVASTKIYNYESGKAEEIFKPRPEVGISTHDLVQRARAEARKPDWKKRIDEPNRSPKVFVAPIAAGEKVIASTNADIYKFIKSNYGDAIAVEMEGFGLLRAAHSNQHVSAMAIRGISDLIDGKETADGNRSQEIASCHASAFAFEILAKFQPEQKSGAEAKTHYNIAGDYVAGDKVTGNKNENIASGPKSVVIGGSAQGATLVTGDRNVINNTPNSTIDREDRLSNQAKSPAELARLELQKEYDQLTKKYGLINEQIAGEMNEDNKETLRTRRDRIKKQMDLVWNQLQ
jgi:Phosphorylase superfamily/Effector-associated domain 9